MSDKIQSATDQDCLNFQNRLPELFEEQASFEEEEHLRHCTNCQTLVKDLQYIAQQAKLLLPLHEPSDAVWNSIQDSVGREQANAESSRQEKDNSIQ